MLINVDAFKTPENIRLQNQRYRKKNLDKCRKWSAESYHRSKEKPENIKKYLLKYAHNRAKKKNLEYTLTVEDIILPTHCPILGVKLNKNNIRYGYSLDRKDPSKGYTKDNIWVISQLANAMKWDSTHGERVAFATWVLSLEGGSALC
jgi:hypothetical protein